MFNFTPLAGAQSSSRASQSLLELDGGVKVLVDLGWDERFSTAQLADVEKHASTLSFILLTHATLSHLGAFAHCCKHIPLFSQIPVYATAPVVAFGRTLLQDLYTSAPAAATFIPTSASPEDKTSTDSADRTNILRNAPSPEEINKYFSSITPLKYSQPHQPAASFFSAPLEGLTLTAFNAGHTLGGTIWHIQHGMESIVYAVDWHQAKENVIAGAAWFDGLGGAEVNEALRKPTALICSSVNGDKIALQGGTRGRDDCLIGHIRSTIARGGTVLIPTDSSARLLELSYLLEKTWQARENDNLFKSAKVYLAACSANATLRHARSMVEWMDESIVREFEADEEGATNAKTHKRAGSKVTDGDLKPLRPFEFRHIKVVETSTRLSKIIQDTKPKVIVASDVSLEWGLSRMALEGIAQNSSNLVLLTDQSSVFDGQSGANVQTLALWYKERKDGVAVEKSSAGQPLEQIYVDQELVFFDGKRSPLDPAELAKYQQYSATQEQIQSSLLTADGRQLAAVEDALDEDDESSSESEDEENEQQGRALNITAALTHGNRAKVAVSDQDLGVNILLRKRDVHDFDVRNKKGRNAMFPYIRSRKRIDEWGEFIKPEDFLREEERDAQENLIDNKGTPLLGLKRRWSEMDQNDNNKKRRKDGNPTALVDGNPAADGVSSDDSDSEEEDDDDSKSWKTAGEVPSKIVYQEKTIRWRARIAYVDFTGIHDQRSLQMIIPLVAPKRLIITGGSQTETSTLAADCAALFGTKVVGHENEAKTDVYTPRNGQTIDASVDTNAWIVKLTRDLAKRLQWQHIKQIDIVTVLGQLRADTAVSWVDRSTASSKKVKLDTEQEKTQISEVDQPHEPVLDTIPPETTNASRVMTQPIHVGDLRLADLRRLMRDNGHQAVFRGEGLLLIDDMVAVRKLASGRIVVEGAPMNQMHRIDSFAQVKRMIYDGLAVVAAG